MDYCSNKTQLPQNVTVTPWSVVSNASTAFFTVDQIESAAKTVQSYVETNHTLPSSVTISGTVVSMSQFLQLATTALLNIDDSLYTSIVLKSYNAATSPSETITTNGTITSTDYINLANDIISYMRTNGKAPDYRTINLGNLRFESLVYMYSQILSSHNATGALPEFITVTPWSVVSNSSTVFITTDQIKNASETVKSYLDTNHTLPSNVNISGRDISMPQFLKLSTKAVINIENYLNTSIILDSVGGPTNPTENITSGTILSDEFVNMATYIKSYMDSHGTAPNNVTNTSIGDTICYESLIYMFSKIMSSYNATGNAPDEVSVTPWLALSNPNGTFNFRTQKVFNNIQSAIDDADTISGDTIWLEKAIYSENVVINKKVTIRPISGVNVTIQALNTNLPIFTININGNGTIIQEFIINGSTGNSSIYINNSTNNQILGNNITSSYNGIYLYNSAENIISGNSISNNIVNGIFINTCSDNNTISGNKLTSSGSAGISILNSNNNKVYSNILSNNLDGIYLNNSSTEIHFNQIVGNSRYGLYSQGNGTVNATNNWWGSNNPIISSASPSDINIAGGNVTYNPWLVLGIKSSTDRSDRSGAYYNYTITADLTHNNQGNDTSSDGSIPDDIPVYFNSTLGTINTSGSTKKGKAELKLSSTAAGTADVSVTLNNQQVSQAVNITSVDVLGVYNTRTQESFANIQAAIDDIDTRGGDIITLAEGTYTENVAVNKKFTLRPLTGVNVTVKAKNDDMSVFTINNDGSASTIQGLNIISSIDSYGISLSHSYNNNIINNTISDSNRGIYLYVSGNNNITGNIIKDSYYGITLYNSTSNNISGNTIKDNENGIYFFNSNYNTITGSTIANNYYGSYLYHSNNNNVTSNIVSGNWVGVYLYDTNNNNITGNNLTDNGAGITYHNSIGTILSGNSFIDNWLADTSVVDSSEMIMATTIYTCGPAALATILKSIGIYTTEAEIAQIAGIDETGTSLYGLKTAAQAKGVTAIGARLTTDQLKTNYIVVLSVNEVNHFEVIQNITNTTVYLFDSNLGNIEMTRDKFNELYTGVALLINEQAPANATILTDDEMRNIKALGRKVQIGGWWEPPKFWVTYKKIYRTVTIPYLHFDRISVYRWGPINIGYWWPSLRFKKVTVGISIPVFHYIPPKYHPVYIWVPDIGIQYKPDRVVPALKTYTTVGGALAGVAVTVYFSGGAILPIAAGTTASVVPCGISLYLDSLTGDLDKVWHDPWLDITVDGHPVFGPLL